MINIHLDTALFAIPNYEFGVSSKKVAVLIDRINYFYRMIVEDNVPVRFFLSSDAEDTLGADFPHPDAIEDFLRLEGLNNQYASNDLYMQYVTLMDRALRPSEQMLFEPVAVDGFSSMPPLRPGLGPASLLAETERVLTTVAAQASSRGFWRLGSSMTDTAALNFNIKVTVRSGKSNDHPSLALLPMAINSPVRALEHLDELLETSSALELWSKAETPHDIYVSILFGAYRIRKNIVPFTTIKDLKRFSLGSDFQRSLIDHECSGTQRFSSVAFDVCCRVVADANAIPIGIMGRPKQTFRQTDNAAACRTHITTGNPALRLMHWDHGNGIEFSNVGYKKDLYIAAGTGSTISAENVFKFVDEC